MSDLSGLVTGLAQGLNGYLQTAQKTKADQSQAAYQSQLDTQKELTVNAAKNQDDGTTATPEATVNPEMAEKLLPGAGGNLVQAFQQQNNRLPTLKEAHDYLKQASDSLQPPDTAKTDAHQDTLEKQALDRLTSLRGDAAISRAELQRDAAGQAYDTISKAQHENRDLSSLEQTDLLAQLFQARTGKAPTDSDMKALNDKTAKQGLNQAVTYITGNPNLIGASTKDTLDNLKQFVQSTGSKADQNHEAYMAPRLVKPTGLNEDRWNHIVSTNRGISFDAQMKTSDTTYSKAAKEAAGSLEDRKAALRAKLGL